MVLALAQKGWSVYQLDIKSVFLHGELKEDVYVEQPLGYIRKGKEERVYKLKKTLYGLKQAPRAWYNKIEAYFVKEGSVRYDYEHTLFVKIEEGGKRFLIGIYLSQKKYACELLEKFGLQNANSVKNPIVPGFKLSEEGEDVGELLAYTDSDYGDTMIGRTHRLCVFIEWRSVYWASKKQLVTLSTIKVNYGVAFYACQCIWMRRMLEKIGHSQSKCTTIMCDNSSTIKLSKNPIMHGRSKHIDVRFHFLRNLTKKEVVKLVHCGTNDQVADI
ncbi:hypothetical protein AAG906_039949 [Vitis piasezkii]